MPIKNTALFKTLSNIIQTSHGKSSEAKYATHFVQMSVPADGQLLIKYQTIVNFGHQNVYLELRRKYRDEAVEVIKQHLEKVAREYKEAIENKGKLLEPKVEPYEAAPPKTIKLTLIPETVSESLESVSKSIYSPVGTAFYRVQCVAEIK